MNSVQPRKVVGLNPVAREEFIITLQNTIAKLRSSHNRPDIFNDLNLCKKSMKNFEHYAIIMKTQVGSLRKTKKKVAAIEAKKLKAILSLNELREEAEFIFNDKPLTPSLDKIIGKY
ncbi:uncharacterized protein LOC119689779 [Teleopsis dalmanni]|uniref:uncharacterized protein LOC119689779 n=1 Tax=Teleopsis dalmanni TaxID=139649 RepID=UPI0018CE1653|nr:uncharacterized protein LOC119689779 [Teleopsis dalmanni]